MAVPLTLIYVLILSDCDSDISPKYGIVDSNMAETASLESVFLGINVFLWIMLYLVLFSNFSELIWK